MPAWKFREPIQTFSKVCEVCGETHDFQVLGARNYRLGLKQEVFVLNHEDVICPSCGFIFSLHVPDQGFLSDLYRQFYNPHFDLTDIAPSYDLDFRIKTIETYLERGSRILEIGSLDGFMAEPLRNRGYSYQATDPTNNKSENHDHDKILLGKIPDKSKYNAISSYYVLEHVSHVRPWIEEITTYLKPDGLMIFEVPNLLTHPRSSLSSLHFYHFTPFHITSLLEDMGFTILSMSHDKASRNYGMCCVAQLRHISNNNNLKNKEMSCPADLRQQAIDIYQKEKKRRQLKIQKLEDTVGRIFSSLNEHISQMYLWPANGDATIIGDIIKNKYPDISCRVVDDSPTREGLYQEGFNDSIIHPKSIPSDGLLKVFVLCSENWNHAIFRRIKDSDLARYPVFDCSTNQILTSA